MIKILIASQTNIDVKIFKQYLKSLRNLNTPVGCRVDKHFVFHNCDYGYLLKDGESYEEYISGFEYIRDEQTHHWNDKVIDDVIKMKNNIINVAKKYGYDYIFYVDSDLLLHPDMLINLFEQKKTMISACFWTKWQKEDERYLPNCWNYDGYGFIDGFVDLLKNKKGNFLVGGTGACTLLHKDIWLYDCINWDKLYNYSEWGEDRHFCIKVVAHGHPIYTNNELPVWHIYRDSEFRNCVGEYKKLLGEIKNDKV